MAAPKYRLEALLTVKQRVKQRATFLLAKALKRLEEEKEKLKRLEEEKSEILQSEERYRHEMDEEMNKGGCVFDGTIHLNYLRKLKEDEEAKEKEIEAQHEIILEAEGEVATCRRHYIDACKELQVMEKHKGLWEKKIRVEISRREEKEFDELANTIHQLRKWRGDESEDGALGS